MTTTRARRPRPRAIVLLAAVLLTGVLPALGCTSSADAAGEEAVPPAVAEPVEISSFEEATYTALVADRAGTRAYCVGPQA